MREKPRRFPIGIIIGFSTLVVATGGAAAFLSWQTFQNKPTPVATQTPQPTPSKFPVPSSPSISQSKPNPKAISSNNKFSNNKNAAQIYWVRDQSTDLKFVPTASNSGSDNSPETQITAAMNRLLATPPNKDLTTTIPQGTELRSVRIESNNVYVDLSQAFTSGGGSLSMQGRIAQVLYTASSLDPKARVYLSVEGEPLTVLGGEGLIVEQPLTRSQFEQENGAKTE